MRELALLTAALKPTLAGLLVLFAFLTLVASLLNFVSAAVGRAWRIPLTNSEHWVMLAALAVLYVLK